MLWLILALTVKLVYSSGEITSGTYDIESQSKAADIGSRDEGVAESIPRLPVWPMDFKWSFTGVPSNYDCIQITDTKDPNNWDDNYFCWLSDRKNPGFKWTSSGMIPGMRCIPIKEPSEPKEHTWNDNYLCLPDDCPYNFIWSHFGQIPGKSCMKWAEPSDSHTWDDNYLCAEYGSGSPKPLPIEEAVFPDDFKWSSDGIPEGYDCIAITEPSDEDSWLDNFFCWKEGRKDPGLKWSFINPIEGMRCTQITEPSEPSEHNWHDNYLCVPKSSPLRFIWSYHEPLKDHSCIQWLEKSDKHHWDDNYLCFERCQLLKLEIIDPEQYTPTYEGTQVLGSVSGAHCLTAMDQEHTLSISSVDSVTETTSVEVAKSHEINWGISRSVEISASVSILGTGVETTLGHSVSLGGAHSWSRAETKEFSQGGEVSVGHETVYKSPGGAIMFGEVNRYKFDKSDIPTKMHMKCPSGGSFIKSSTIKMKATTFQSAQFETMSGRFYQKACRKDPSIGDCVKLVDDQYNNFFGSMKEVRDAFMKCFEDDKGYLGWSNLVAV